MTKKRGTAIRVNSPETNCCIHNTYPEEIDISCPCKKTTNTIEKKDKILIFSLR